MNEKSVTCPFCGQGVLVENSEKVHPDDLIEYARQSCSCPGAVAYRKKQNTISNSLIYIGNLFSGEKSSFTINSFRSAVVAVVEHAVDSVAIKKGKENYVIDLDGDGCLRIKKTFKDVSEENF